VSTRGSLSLVPGGWREDSRRHSRGGAGVLEHALRKELQKRLGLTRQSASRLAAARYLS